MALLVNILFALTTIAVFGYFAFNLRRSWQRITTTGQGFEEVRSNEPILRLQRMLLGGLLQKRMFKDLTPGVMHFVIFWGFVTVSLRTPEPPS